MTDAELHELIMMSADQIDSAFEFWLTISFGVLIAIHVTRGAINSYIKLLMCGLYLAATSVAVLLMLGDLMQIGAYAQDLEFAIGGKVFSAASDYIRLLIYIVGSASVSVAIFRYEVWIEDHKDTA
jgi:hypothetical protein